MEEEFKVSKKLLKTITVDTRTNILKTLEKRPMTASELSRTLNKHVTTVTEHLDVLKNSDLVERVERPGRKWIYYKLTKPGVRILHPESYKFVIMFATVIIGIVGGWFIFSVEAYPGDLLYGIHRAAERLQLVFIRDDLQAAGTHIELAEKRLAEAKVAAERGYVETASDLLEEYQNEMNTAKAAIENARKNNMSIISILETVSEATSKQASILENIKTKSPALGVSVQPALNESIQQHESAINDLQNITGKPYASAMRPSSGI
jgi:DNA-binding transcriptional ArsR family regulator